MYSDDLKKLIDAALVDGVITDKERFVIRKHAISEGVDPDEVDILLDAELYRRTKSPKLPLDNDINYSVENHVSTYLPPSRGSYGKGLCLHFYHNNLLVNMLQP